MISEAIQPSPSLPPEPWRNPEGVTTRVPTPEEAVTWTQGGYTIEPSNYNPTAGVDTDITSHNEPARANTVQEVTGTRHSSDKYNADFARSMIDRIGVNMTAEDQLVVEQIIYGGQLDGQNIDIIEDAQRSASDTILARTDFARLFRENPAEAKLLAYDQVAGFHGTKSAALAGIFKHGYLGSAQYLRGQKSFVFSGEHYFQSPEGQGSISFSSMGGLKGGALNRSGHFTRPQTLAELKAGYSEQAASIQASGGLRGSRELGDALLAEQKRAIDFIEANPASLEAQLTVMNFPVLVTVSRDYVEGTGPNDFNPRGLMPRGGIILGPAEEAEFQLLTEKVPKEDIPLILVPADQVSMVKDLCAQYGFNKTRVSDIDTYIAATDYSK